MVDRPKDWTVEDVEALLHKPLDISEEALEAERETGLYMDLGSYEGPPPVFNPRGDWDQGRRDVGSREEQKAMNVLYHDDSVPTFTENEVRRITKGNEEALKASLEDEAIAQSRYHQSRLQENDAKDSLTEALHQLHVKGMALDSHRRLLRDFKRALGFTAVAFWVCFGVLVYVW